nr:TorF family putative porin [Jiella sp. LLJ827]
MPLIVSGVVSGPAFGEEKKPEASDLPAFLTTESPFDLSVTLSGLTDYVSLRGYSQTARDPALQATVEASYGDFSVGFFAANVHFGTSEPKIEFDPFVAYRTSYENWSLDLTYYYYTYQDAKDSDYPEFFHSLSYNFDDLATVTGTFAYASDYFGQSDTGYFYKGAVSVPLPNDFTFSGSVGYQDFAEGKFVRHWVWDAGVSYALGEAITLDVRYHDTDIDEDVNCTGGAFQCGATIVGKVSVATSLSAIRKRFQD